MKKILLIFILFLSISCVYAGDNVTTETYDSDIHNIDTNNFTYAMEDGHLNTSFSNGYNGYCIEYGEHEANKNDEFAVANTSYIRNNPSGKDVSNYIKTYFVYFYDDMTNNPPVYTQHIIWYYTDNFTHHITTPPDKIKAINQIAETNYIPDDGKLSTNSTTMVYSFRSLISPLNGYQNYFAYRIYFDSSNDNIPNLEQNNITNITNITNTTNATNITITNITESINQTNNTTQNIKNNYIKNQINKTCLIKTNKKQNTYTSKYNLSKHKTGNSIGLLAIIIFVVCVSLIRRE